MNIRSSIRSTQAPKPPAQQHECPPCKEPKEEESFLAKTADLLVTGTKNTLNEGVLAAKNDPALAMRMAATTLSDTLLKKVDAPVKAGFEKTIVPVMRFALLGGNTFRAVKTFSDPNSKRLDKVIDATVVASDLAGAIGGIAMLTGSKYAGVGETVMGLSYAVDAVTHAYRTLNHAGDRIKFWTNGPTEN